MTMRQKRLGAIVALIFHRFKLGTRADHHVFAFRADSDLAADLMKLDSQVSLPMGDNICALSRDRSVLPGVGRPT